MKKNGQVANKSKINAVQANKKNTPAKAPAMKAKKGPQARGGNNFNKKSLLLAKNGKNKNSEDDEEDSDDDSGADLETSGQNIAGDSEESNGVENGNDAEDSDSDEAEEDDDDNSEPEEMAFKKFSIKQEEESDDEEDDEREIKQEEESEDEAPVEKQFKKASKTSSSTKETPAPNKDRKIFVKRLEADVTEAQIKEHFASCGKVELIKKNIKGRKAEAMIVFTDAEASQAALKLHNSILNDTNILVHHACVDRPRMEKDHSILVMNVDGLQKLESEKLENVLSKCGEIDSISVVCEKNVLAFVTFKNAESVKKAMKLDGTTQNGIQIKINTYSGKAPKTKIFVKNIDKGATEAEIKEMFEACGPIQHISIRKNDNFPTTAIIVFENQESYCQSFLLHEEKLRGRPLEIIPFSDKRKGQQKPNRNFQKTPFKGKRPQSGMWKNGPPAKKNKA